MPTDPEIPEPGAPPIARSYYDAPEPGGQKTAPSGKPPSQSWFAGIPGFRSRTAWKAIVAVLGYFLILLLIVSGFSSPTNAVLAMSALVVALLVTDAWGIRDRIPMLRSSNKLIAASGWVAVALLILTSMGFAAPSHPSPRPGPAIRPAASASSNDVAIASPVSTPSLEPSPSPSAAAPSPVATQAPVAPPAPPAPPPPPPPPPQPTGVNGNPWGYDFNPGNYITAPPGAFCTYFSCIASFANGTGYVMECVDGMYSLSGGHSGSCSHHGGNKQPLYSH
jgi:hypothetical protein